MTVGGIIPIPQSQLLSTEIRAQIQKITSLEQVQTIIDFSKCASLKAVTLTITVQMQQQHLTISMS